MKLIQMIQSCIKLFVLCVLLTGCGQKNNNSEKLSSVPPINNELLDEQDIIEILFEIKTNDPEYLKSFPDGIIPWISIEDVDQELKQLIGKNEIVLTENEVDVTIDYPVDEPFNISLKSDKPSGFTRGELILKISKEYKRIYKEEEASAKEKTIPIEKREGVINRNTTDGKYGIWGHDLGDLDLSEIIVHRKSGKKTRLELYIES
ncbi:hypothetical protein [Fluviicola taffensis]|uniref:hypothetical protein n=1 Tax=Fluviicola taffensis TaxID=191579 RepID=UPI003137CA81